MAFYFPSWATPRWGITCGDAHISVGELSTAVGPSGNSAQAQRKIACLIVRVNHVLLQAYGALGRLSRRVLAELRWDRMYRWAEDNEEYADTAAFFDVQSHAAAALHL